MIKKLMCKVGPWVEKEIFWGRKDEVEQFIKLLDEGNNILITAPRRIGKTSLIREAGNRIAERYCCLQLDLQKCNSPADVITELSVATRPHFGLWNKTKDVFRNAFSTATGNIDALEISDLTIKFRDALSLDWQKKGDSIIKKAAGHGKPVIIFMDEFPLVINRLLKGSEYKITPDRLKETERLLSWIRSITTQYKGKIRIVLTGSIGLEPILAQARLSHTINTFTPFELEPWDRDTAAGCLQALANSYEVCFLESAKEQVLDLIDSYIPHHVQMFFQYLLDDCKKRKNKEISREDAERIYNTRMLSTRGHAELSTYEERLKMVLSPTRLPLALEILTEAAVTGKLTPETAEILRLDFNLEDPDAKNALREIIGILEHDGYLVKKEKEHVFVSKLVRDWWKARFGFQYVPAGERGKKE